jgi:hypothetical protein
MSGFFLPPTFEPSVPPIRLGTPGQVLTMVNGRPAFAAGGGGGTLGTYLAFASPAGSSNNVNPAGFGAGVGLIDVTLAGGDATWTGLLAGANRQMLVIANADALANLTLAALNAGSAAANRFRASGDIVLPPLSAHLFVYYTTPALWIAA